MNFLALVTTIVLAVSTPTKPELRRINGSSNYLAFNPLTVPIEMKIICLGDYDPVILPMDGGTKMELELKQPSGYAAACFLDSYKKLPVK